MISSTVKEHYERMLGGPSRTARFDTSGRAVEIYKWDAEANPQGVCIYATAGMSDHVLEGYDPAHRLELFMGLLPAEDRIAKPLAMLALSPVINDSHLAGGHTVTFPEPFWPGSGMYTFLVRYQHGEVVPPVSLDDGTHVEFLQVIPIFPSELNYKSQNGLDALIEKWQAARVQFWNPNRPPHPA